MVESAKYLDPWQEYKFISGKLKRRFMRKPNLSEASREFGALARRLHEDEQCDQYAALCHLAAARCESQSGNHLAENAGLKQAARFFMTVQKSHEHLGLPGFQENLASAIHCYSHAIRTHLEAKQFALAGHVCMELGSHLVQLSKTAEATEYFQKAVRYLDAEPNGKCQALWNLAECQTDCDQPHDALATVDELWATLIKLDTPSPAVSNVAKHGHTSITWRHELLRDAEVATVFLLVHMRSLPQHMTERHATLYTQYCTVQGHDEAMPNDTYVNENDYLLLQSFVLAVQWRDAAQADRALTELLPRLKALHGTLGIDIVEKLYLNEYDVE